VSGGEVRRAGLVARIEGGSIMSAAFSLAGLAVARGEKSRHVLSAASRPSGLPIEMPVMIAHGRGDGPTLCAVSGVHGDEYEGGEAICRVWQEIDPDRLRGTFVAVPTINMPALESGTRNSPLDGENLNRIFPGNPGGGVSHRIARYVFENIALHCDYLVDFHGGGIDLAHASVANYRIPPDPALVDRARRFAEASGIEIIVHNAPGSGQLVDEVIKVGPIALNIEVGGEGRLSEPGVREDVTALWNLMRHLEMVDGIPIAPARRIHITDRSTLRVSAGGIWRSNPELVVPVTVQSGDLIGTVGNVYRDTVETVTAPHDGFLYVLRSFPRIQAGDWVAFLGKDVETETLAG
jgi:uncharacterized protein